MDATKTERRLVKSPPELWAEISDPTALNKHLEPFGEIRITRVEPESAVAWEGERASGTVALEPSGWGTRVTLTAVPQETDPHSTPVPVGTDPQRTPVRVGSDPQRTPETVAEPESRAIPEDPP